MTTISKAKIVPYTAIDMFQLVDGIEKYPEYIPWCDQTIIHFRDVDQVQASIVIAAGGMKKSFTTHNRMQQGKMIEIRLVDGPFKHLEGFWRFEPLDGNSCKVLFDLEFEFSSKLISFAIGPVFTQATSTLVDAFCKQADKLHGN